MQTKTIVAGGGIAGISCALQLLNANQDFLLVTDDLGGRIKYSKDAKVNFGAYFVMSNYTNAKKIVSKGPWINPVDSCFHKSATEGFAAISWHTVAFLPDLIRFYVALRKFTAHYEPFKQRCLMMTQKEALEADPYMADIFSKPASQFIREQGLERVASDYIAMFAYACTGASLEQVNALDLLNVSQGMVTPIHCIEFDPEVVAQKLGKHLVYDKFVRLVKGTGQVTLTSEEGKTYQAENLILATPADVTRKLLGIGDIRAASKIFVFHVKADLKAVYRQQAMNLFPSTSEFMLVVRQLDGSYLIYSREEGVDLHEVCERFELLKAVKWEKAMYVDGKAYLEQQYGDNIYVAGDHNGLGLEPAAISGIFSAKQVINKAISTHP